METRVTIIIISSIIAFICLSFWGVNLANKKVCLESYKEYNPQYTIWSGCRVEWNDKITPVDIIREIN